MRLQQHSRRHFYPDRSHTKMLVGYERDQFERNVRTVVILHADANGRTWQQTKWEVRHAAPGQACSVRMLERVTRSRSER